MNDNEIEIRAGEWLARLDRGEASPGVLAEFQRWKTADARHAAAYARLAATWQALDRVQVLQSAPDNPIRPDYLSERRRPRPIARTARRIAIAAAVLIAAGALSMWHISPDTAIYETTRGGFQRIVLKDHSAIELNTDTKLRVELNSSIRKVELIRGEASFEVAHEPNRPFVVAAGRTGVLAVGTRFNVLKLDNSVEVTVDEGRVLIGSPEELEHTRRLEPNLAPLVVAGETAISGSDGVKLKSLPKDAVARKLAWQDQMLAFDGDALSEVIAQFNRYNDRQLVIVDPSVAAMKVGGYFRQTNLDEFVNVLESNFGLHATFDGNRILLAPAAAK
jgi:transmembrane sensor